MGNIFKRKKDIELSRTIYPSISFPRDSDFFEDPNAKFADNRVKTTKYSILNFIPLNLWEQLHRFANAYFIFIVILNFMPRVEAFAKEVAPIPVLVVLALTAIKDAYEDFRRYLADQKVNHTVTEVFCIDERKFVKRQWAHLRPGDIVRLHTNEVIPADILMLNSSDISGMCHIETANLDGENNLKQRETIRWPQKKALTPIEFVWSVEVEAPNAELYKFSGKILTPKPIIVRKENLLLRGCTLRNTDTIQGMIIYAGRETKASLNNSGRNFKRSKLERRINNDIIWCVLILAIVCVTGAIGSFIWLQSFPGFDVPFLADNKHSESALNSFINFWTFIIIFQAIIPLPLYITIEFVKLFQVWFITHDIELYDSVKDNPTKVHAFNIPEDLGQIEYIFSDKTGTLTENKMVFQRAFINGVDYWADEDILFNSISTIQNVEVCPYRLSSVQNLLTFGAGSSFKKNVDELEPPKFMHEAHSTPNVVIAENELQSPENECQHRIQEFFLCLTICNTVVVSANKNISAPFAPATDRGGFHRFNRSKREAGYFSRFRSFFHSSGNIRDEESSSSTPRSSRSERGGSARSLKSLFTRRNNIAATVMEANSRDYVFCDKMEGEEMMTAAEIAGRSNLSHNSSEKNNKITVSRRPLKSRLLSVVQESSEYNLGVQPKYAKKKTKTSNIGEPPPILNSLFIPDEESSASGGIRHSSSSSNESLDVLREQEPSSSQTHFDSPITADGLGAGVGEEGDRITKTEEAETGSYRSLLNHKSKRVCPLSENILMNGYESESPDEVALVRTACHYGCKLLQRGGDFVIIWLPDDGVVRVEVLTVLPFDCNRKRMSIIVRHPATGEIVIYVKGADSAILECLASSTTKGDNLRSTTEDCLKTYSHAGLRTLVMAMRIIPENEYQQWSLAYHNAETNYAHADDLKLRLMNDIEVGLELLGATGIEDRLQDGVPDTIAAVREAGMKVWVLTGDKQETATSIAYAAKLITDNHKLFTLNPNSPEEAERQIKAIFGELLTNPANAVNIAACTEDATHMIASTSLGADHQIKGNATMAQYGGSHDNFGYRDYGSQDGIQFLQSQFSVLDPDVPGHISSDLALVLSGQSLDHVLHDSVKGLFLRLASVCSSVIICRVTPCQKALVVTTVKTELKVQTLAIGDGANDVNMIQCADVGIGISGQEGMQAVMASDFAISRFSFLKRLLLVHGHWCYEKLARMALYMFYKDAVYIFSLFWYQFFNGFSGSAHIDQFSQILFNLTMTSIPPFILGIFDKPLDQRTLMANPKIYRSGRDSMTYRPWHFWMNTFDAMWQSLVIFFIPFAVYWDSNAGMWEMGMTCMNSLVFVSIIHICLETKYWTLFHFTVYIGSYLVLWLFFTMIYHVVGVTQLQPDPPYYVILVAMQTGNFWLCFLLCTPFAILPRVLMNSILNTFAPSLDTISARLERKYGVGVRLPLDRFLNEYSAYDFCSHISMDSVEIGGGSARDSVVSSVVDFSIAGSPERISIPENIRSKVWLWFTSGGRLLSRMPFLRHNIDEPVLRRVSLVSRGYGSDRPSSAPNFDARLVTSVVRQNAPNAAHLRHQRSSTFGEDGRFFNASFDTKNPFMYEERLLSPRWRDAVPPPTETDIPFVTQTSGERSQVNLHNQGRIATTASTFSTRLVQNARIYPSGGDKAPPYDVS